MKFTREQLVCVVGVIVKGAADQAQSCLPPVISGGEFREREKEIRDYLHGVTNLVGIQIPILYCQLTGEGLGAGDFRGFGKFADMVSRYIDCPTGTMQGVDELVESIVDDVFGSYLA